MAPTTSAPPRTSGSSTLRWSSSKLFPSSARGGTSATARAARTVGHVLDQTYGSGCGGGKSSGDGAGRRHGHAGGGGDAVVEVESGRRSDRRVVAGDHQPRRPERHRGRLSR